MTVTLDVCCITSSVAPSFPLHWPDSSLFCKASPCLGCRCPEPCMPCRLRSAGCSSSAHPGGPGDGDQLCPGEDPASCFAGFISPALIIAAPGGIVPYYYTVDLCLIRHQLKPPAPSWHSCLLRAPSASTCPFLYRSHRAPVTVSGQNESQAPPFIPSKPGDPQAGQIQRRKDALGAFLCWQQVLALRRLLPTARAAQRSPPRGVQPSISGA